MKQNKTIWSALGAIVVILAGALAQQFFKETPAPSAKPTTTEIRREVPHSDAPRTVSAPSDRGGSARASSQFGDERTVLDAIRSRKSGVLAIVQAKVFKILPDDTDGIDHQRFLVELRGGQTLLVAHNTDLASRVPIKLGDIVELAGQYEWNEQGGVMHWTHHDPGKRRPDGWIALNGKKYQ